MKRIFLIDCSDYTIFYRRFQGSKQCAVNDHLNRIVLRKILNNSLYVPGLNRSMYGFETLTTNQVLSVLHIWIFLLYLIFVFFYLPSTSLLPNEKLVIITKSLCIHSGGGICVSIPPGSPFRNFQMRIITNILHASNSISVVLWSVFKSLISWKMDG